MLASQGGAGGLTAGTTLITTSFITGWEGFTELGEACFTGQQL